MRVGSEHVTELAGAYPGVIDSAVRLPEAAGRIDADTWFALAARWGISHAVAAPPDRFVSVDNDEGNAAMAALAARRPKELSCLAVANPWYGDRAVESLRRAFDGGLRGLYLHPARQGFQLTESIVDPLIEVCLAFGRPVYAYTSTPVCAMPFQLAELARRFPDLPFVMGHMGWSDFSGYDVIPASLQAPNIVIETSCAAWTIVKAAIEALGIERLLFGTGYPRSLPEHEFENIGALNLADADLELYLRGNARRLWKIPACA